MNNEDKQLVPPSSRPKRFFDVVPPNQSTPSTTSRPVIVSNRPEQVDPMVNQPGLSANEAIASPQPSPNISTPDTPFTAELAQASVQPDSATRLMLEEYKEIKHEISPATVQPASPPSIAPEKMEPDAAAQSGYGEVSQPVVAHDSRRPGVLHGIILWLFVIFSLLILINILLDAQIWKPPFDLPHTNLFNKVPITQNSE